MDIHMHIASRGKCDTKLYVNRVIYMMMNRVIYFGYNLKKHNWYMEVHIQESTCLHQNYR